jgi:hypothetical protein
MAETKLLHVALQDGFFNDTVTICINGKELARRSNVTTKTQIGLASVVELQVPPGHASLQVCVAGRPPSATLTVDLTQPVHVGVSVGAGGEIVYTRSESPFRYA